MTTKGLPTDPPGFDSRIRGILQTDGVPFSPEARRRIEDLGSEYAEDLVLEAARMAKRQRLQQIGTAHVEEAKKRLLSIDQRSWLKRTCSGFGGALLGVGATPFVALWAGSALPASLTLAGAMALIAGAVLLMFGVRD